MTHIKRGSSTLGRVFLFLVLLEVIHGSEGISSSCTVQRQTDRSGRLCCRFSEDIAKLKHGFQVKRYSLDLEETKPEIILDCMWLRHSGLDCKLYSSKPFRITTNVSSTFDLGIPEFTNDYTGRYECVLVPPGGGQVSPCQYNHQIDGQMKITASTPKPRQPPTNTAGGEAREEDGALSSGNDIMYIVAIVILAVVTVIALTLVAVLIRRHRKRKASNNSSSSGNINNNNNNNNNTSKAEVMLLSDPV